MDARSSDDALPSAPPEPAGAPLPSQPHSPTHNHKQAEVRALLLSLPEGGLEDIRSCLERAFPTLKLQNNELDSLSQLRITTCQNNIRPYFEFIVSGLSALGPDRLPNWLARRIFIIPNQDRWPIIPDDDLFQVYCTWCTSNEEFDFYSALTELLNLGLQVAATVSEEGDEIKYAMQVLDRSISKGKTLFDGMLIRKVNDHLYKEPA
ncbi:hypothetical protein ACQY0O_003239 [Thecaphora frezii]